MQILFVYKYLTVGGVEAVLQTRLRELPLLGIEAMAWFLADCGGAGMFAGLDDRVRVGDLFELHDFLHESRFDLVSTIDSPEIFPLFRGQGLPPLVLEVHTTYEANVAYLSQLRGTPIRGVIVPSRAQADMVRRKVGRSVDIHIAPNPLNRAVAEAPVVAQNVPGRPIIAWVGRLDEHKNWKAFLNVGSVLARRGLEFELLMIGRPSEPAVVDQLRRRAQREGLLRHFRWLPAIPHRVIPRMLDAVALSGGVFVSTSRDESFGMAIAEAMARSCPVVVPARAPFDELVSDGRTGMCYEPGSAEDAAEAVAGLLRHPAHAREMGRSGREFVLSLCGADNALRTLARCFDSLSAEDDGKGGLAVDDVPGDRAPLPH